MKEIYQSALEETDKQRQTQRLAAQFEAEAVPHLPMLQRIALQLMRNSAEAEDLVQETYAQALKSFARYQAGTNCRAWLCKIMFRKRSHFYRANNRFVPLDEGSSQTFFSSPTDLPPEYISDKLTLALLTLPENFRLVLMLCETEELTYREVSEKLQIPLGTVMSRLHRARKLLRVEFEKVSAKCQTARLSN